MILLDDTNSHCNANSKKFRTYNAAASSVMSLHFWSTGQLAGQLHRCDSIQGTDYIANPFILNLKVSRTTIGNLR